MAKTITPFLMFEGAAEQAMSLYLGLFRGSSIERITHYGAGEAGAKGSVKRADFTIAGQRVICIDSPVKHAFAFTPSMSLFVECDDETEFQTAFETLSKDGRVLMEPNDYGFSRRFAWLDDRFGVSWQLNVS